LFCNKAKRLQGILTLQVCGSELITKISKVSET